MSTQNCISRLIDLTVKVRHLLTDQSFEVDQSLDNTALEKSRTVTVATSPPQCATPNATSSLPNNRINIGNNDDHCR